MARITTKGSGIDDLFLEDGMVVGEKHNLKFEDEDKKLVKVVNGWIVDSKQATEEILKKAKKNTRYYLGDQLDEKRLAEYQSKIIVNKIFQNLDTLVPVAAANIPAPVCTLPEGVEDDGKAIDYRTYATQLEEMLLAIAQEQHLEYKLQEAVTQLELNYLAVLTYEYCEKEGEIEIEVEDSRKFLLPGDGSRDWVIKRCAKTYGDLKEEMEEGEGGEDLVKKFKGEVAEKGGRILNSSVLSYVKVYLPEFSFYKWGNIIWGKEKNPNWNSEDVTKNHWKEPKIPFIFSDLWTLQRGVYARTTNVEQTLSLQDGINKRKRQWDDNASHANGQTVAYGEAGVTKEEAATLEKNRGKPNSVTFLQHANQGAVQNMTGRALDSSVYEDMVHSISEMDNLWGTHANLRGERTPGEETKGGRKLLISADETRIGRIGGMLDRMSQELYNAIAQLILVHFKEPQYSTYTGADGASKQVKISSDLIKQGLKVRVRTGSTIRKDKVAQAGQALELWRLGALDPISLFERLDDPNPLRTAERLMLFKNAPEQYIPSVSKEYEKRTMADREQEVLTAVAQASIENNLLVQGQTVAPYKDANIQHIWAHMEVINLPTFKELPPEIQVVFKTHVEQELPIAQAKARKDADEAATQQAERLARLTGPDERS